MAMAIAPPNNSGSQVHITQIANLPLNLSYYSFHMGDSYMSDYDDKHSSPSDQSHVGSDDAKVKSL